MISFFSAFFYRKYVHYALSSYSNDNAPGVPCTKTQAPQIIAYNHPLNSKD